MRPRTGCGDACVWSLRARARAPPRAVVVSSRRVARAACCCCCPASACFTLTLLPPPSRVNVRSRASGPQQPWRRLLLSCLGWRSAAEAARDTLFAALLDEAAARGYGGGGGADGDAHLLAAAMLARNVTLRPLSVEVVAGGIELVRRGRGCGGPPAAVAAGAPCAVMTPPQPKPRVRPPALRLDAHSPEGGGSAASD